MCSHTDKKFCVNKSQRGHFHRISPPERIGNKYQPFYKQQKKKKKLIPTLYSIYYSQICTTLKPLIRSPYECPISNFESVNFQSELLLNASNLLPAEKIQTKHSLILWKTKISFKNIISSRFQTPYFFLVSLKPKLIMKKWY